MAGFLIQGELSEPTGQALAASMSNQHEKPRDGSQKPQIYLSPFVLPRVTPAAALSVASVLARLCFPIFPAQIRTLGGALSGFLRLALVLVPAPPLLRLVVAPVIAF
jgi:hypothetical protein